MRGNLPHEVQGLCPTISTRLAAQIEAIDRSNCIRNPTELGPRPTTKFAWPFLPYVPTTLFSWGREQMNAALGSMGVEILARALAKELLAVEGRREKRRQEKERPVSEARSQ